MDSLSDSLFGNIDIQPFILLECNKITLRILSSTCKQLSHTIKSFLESDIYWNVILNKKYNIIPVVGAKALCALLATARTDDYYAAKEWIIERCLKLHFDNYLDAMLESKYITLKNIISRINGMYCKRKGHLLMIKYIVKAEQFPELREIIFKDHLQLIHLRGVLKYKSVTSKEKDKIFSSMCRNINKISHKDLLNHFSIDELFNYALNSQDFDLLCNIIGAYPKYLDVQEYIDIILNNIDSCWHNIEENDVLKDKINDFIWSGDVTPMKYRARFIYTLQYDVDNIHKYDTPELIEAFKLFSPICFYSNYILKIVVQFSNININNVLLIFPLESLDDYKLYNNLKQKETDEIPSNWEEEYPQRGWGWGDEEDTD